MRIKKPRLVQDDGDRISALAPEEEERALRLGDIALRNPVERDSASPAGTRAKADHRKLMQELQDEAEKIRRPRRAA